MATISITVTDEQAAALPLRTDGDGEKETVTEYVQRIIDHNAAHEIDQKRQRDFDSFSVEAKAKAIEEGKKV
jgi:hypothetical protein